MLPHVAAWRPDNTGEPLAVVGLDLDSEVLFDVIHQGVSAAVVQAEDVGLADGPWPPAGGLGVARSGHTGAQDLGEQARPWPWARAAAASRGGRLWRRHGAGSVFR